jgi:hypothetical protein
MKWSRAIWAGSVAALLVGCNTLFAPVGIPDDPLLTGRQPIESRGHPLPVPTHREPLPPGDEVHTMPKSLPKAADLEARRID